MDFGFQIGFLYFTWISGFLDFEVDFLISKWISGFQSGFFKVDLDFWAGHMAYKYMHDICNVPQKMTFVPDRKSVGYKGHCCAVM